jgi:hypothetical protein
MKIYRHPHYSDHISLTWKDIFLLILGRVLSVPGTNISINANIKSHIDIERAKNERARNWLNAILSPKKDDPWK